MMDKDRIAGSAKDFAGKVEGAVGSMAGDAMTQASALAREAEGTVQQVATALLVRPMPARLAPGRPVSVACPPVQRMLAG